MLQFAVNLFYVGKVTNPLLKKAASGKVSHLESGLCMPGHAGGISRSGTNHVGSLTCLKICQNISILFTSSPCAWYGGYRNVP